MPSLVSCLPNRLAVNDEKRIQELNSLTEGRAAAEPHRDMEAAEDPCDRVRLTEAFEERGWIKRDGSKSRAMTILVADAEPAKQKPFGEHPDGSLTLCPEAASILRRMMAWRGRGGGAVLPHDFNADVEEMADVIGKIQGIEFEQNT